MHNLKKIWNRLKERERILEDDGKFKDKSLNLEIFVEFYFEINLIEGQRPAVISPDD